MKTEIENDLFLVRKGLHEDRELVAYIERKLKEETEPLFERIEELEDTVDTLELDLSDKETEFKDALEACIATLENHLYD